MKLRFHADGTVTGLWSDLIPLQAIGTITETRRVSTIEFDVNDQRWKVRKVNESAVLFTNASREECLRWEREHLQ